MMDKRPQPRWAWWIAAHVFNYWWKPCPICGKGFSMNDAYWAGYKGKGCRYAVCANCADKAKELAEVIKQQEIQDGSRVQGAIGLDYDGSMDYDGPHNSPQCYAILALPILLALCSCLFLAVFSK